MWLQFILSWFIRYGFMISNKIMKNIFIFKRNQNYLFDLVVMCHCGTGYSILKKIVCVSKEISLYKYLY